MTNDLVRVLIEAPVPQGALSIRDFLPSIVAALVGVLAGAGTAWVLQRQLLASQKREQDRQARQREIDERYDAGNRALFALFCQANAMLDLKKQIAPYAEHPERWMYLPVLAHEYASTPSVDINSLSFLLDKDLCPNSLRDLYLAQSSFEHARSVLRNRNRIRTEITHQALADAVSPLTEKELKVFTDGLFDAVDQAYGKLTTLQPKLVACLKKLGHGLEPMTFVMIEGAQNQQVHGTQ